MSEQALGGLRVIDLSSFVAGPYCTKLLASLGAEVIKVEQPGAGDVARRMGPFPEDDPHPERSGTFLYLNTGKKGITLDVATATGRTLLLDLVRGADVLVESFEPKVATSLSLSYSDLARENERLVVTSITNFGQSGPYRDYRAEDIVTCAYGGQLYMTGEPDREPVRNGGHQAHFQAGLMAFLGTMSAVMARRLTGRGQQVDISMMEAVASVLEHATIIWSYCSEVNERTGNHFRGQSGWGIYPAKDGYVAVCAGSGTGNTFQRFPQLMEEPRLAEPRFQALGGRTTYRDEVDALMLPWLARHTKEEIYHKAQALRIPFGFVCTTEDIAKSDQLRARDYFVDIDHPATGTLTYPGAPFIMSESPLRYGPAPMLGEHNEEVLCGRLGLSHADLVRLCQRGIS